MEEDPVLSVLVAPCGTRRIWDVNPSAGPIPARNADVVS